MYLLDMHVHTKHSGDNHAEPRDMVEAAIDRGLDGLAFTEHYSYRASEFAEGLFERYADRIGIFRGVEFSCLEGHCLVFGLDTDRFRLGRIPMAELVRIVRLNGGVAIPSHPYRGLGSVGDRVHCMRGISAIEGHNGANLHHMNLRAIEAARSMGLPWTGGSDAHDPADVGSCYTVFQDEIVPASLVNHLREGRYEGCDTRKVSRMARFPI